nr:hypothetical protein [Lysobacter enzymogenes]
MSSPVAWRAAPVGRGGRGVAVEDRAFGGEAAAKCGAVRCGVVRGGVLAALSATAFSAAVALAARSPLSNAA